MRNDIAALHAKTPGYKCKLGRAREIVTRALCTPNALPYVALSGGKDSTVVYGLVREQYPDVPAVWSDDEWWLPETLEYIQRLQAAGLDTRQIRTNAHHTDWFETAGDWDGIPDYARAQGWGLCFLGLRQEESSARRVHLRKFGPLFFVQMDDCWHCNPIHDWSWQDVWAYIISTGLDYNRAYDRLEEIGVEPEYQRIGPLAVERALGYGQIAILRRGWPDLYNRFCAAHPEASRYT
jgi:3'-phosphoadenosine 5'-phosphosulfate sulfotransferase (PAPS reductase)/FAD synthetase